MDLLKLLPNSPNPDSSDSLSFESVFKKSYGSLVYFSFKLVGEKQEAEDIVQDAFVNYWNRRKEVVQEMAVIKSFLYTIVRNASLNVLKHQKVVREFQKQSPSDPWDEKSIENEIIRSEVLSEIYRVIESLPAGCRQITQMSYLDGKKNQEIAEELGVSVNTVKTQKQRALQLMRQKLTTEIFSFFLLLILK